MANVNNFRSGANKSLAKALVAGPNTDFGKENFEFALDILRANSADGRIQLPNNFKLGNAGEKAAKAFAQMALSRFGKGMVTYSTKPLPEETVTKVRSVHNDFQNRQAQKPTPRVGKTAKSGGKTAAIQRKRARAAEDRARTFATKGGQKSNAASA